MIRARCPECSQEVVVRDGRLVRHHGTQMRFSGARWFRTTCRGSGRAVPTARHKPDCPSQHPAPIRQGDGYVEVEITACLGCAVLHPTGDGKGQA